MRSGVPRILLGTGWAFAFASIGCAFAGWQRTTSSRDRGVDGDQGAAAAAPWLLLCAFVLIGASLLAAL